MFAALAVLSRPALAHHISLSTGTAVVESSRVLVSLEVPAEDLLHHYAESRRTDQTWSGAWLREAAARHAAFLLDNLIIRDEAGQRLRGRVVASSIPAPTAALLDFQQLRKLRATFELEYDLAAPPRLLTFQQTFNRGAAELPSQLALLVCRSGGVAEETIRLTSRGNAETVEFDWPAAGDGGSVAPSDARLTPDGATAGLPDWLTGPERFKTLATVIQRDAQGVTVDVYAPLTLLETWTPLARRDADFLDAAEQAPALDALQRLLAGAVRLRTAGGTIASQMSVAVFMPPAARTLDDALPHPQGASAAPPGIGVWTARVGARLRFAVNRGEAPLELEWGLFNNAVLTARALVIDGPSPAEHEFSAYDSVLTLPPTPARRGE